METIKINVSQAVFSDGKLVYLGNDSAECRAYYQAKEGNIKVSVKNLKDVQFCLQAIRAGEPINGASVYHPDPLQEILTKAKAAVSQAMEELGYDSGTATVIANKIREDGEEFIEEVRELGVKSVKAIGRGFSVLGQLLQEISEED